MNPLLRVMRRMPKGVATAAAALMLAAFSVPAPAAPELKTFFAEGVFGRTEPECYELGLPSPRASCFSPVQATISFWDPDAGADDALGLASVVGMEILVSPGDSLNFGYPSPWTPPPYSIISLSIQEAGSGMALSFVARGADGLMIWQINPDGSFRIDDGHFEGVAGDAGSLVWMRVPEPATLPLLGIAWLALLATTRTGAWRRRRVVSPPDGATRGLR